jgi:hypothetical protein
MTRRGPDASRAPLQRWGSERTAGHPCFLEERVRTLGEPGGLGGAPGASRLEPALPTSQGPATGQAGLAARIARLPPEKEPLRQAAAVMGPAGPLPLLQAIAARPADALQHGLAHLQAAERL